MRAEFLFFLRFFDWHYLGLIRQFFAARRRKRHFTVLETLQIPIFIIAKTKKITARNLRQNLDGFQQALAGRKKLGIFFEQLLFFFTKSELFG